MSKKKKDWRTEKERLLKLGLEERRKEYRGNFMSLEKISTWRKHEKTTGKMEEDEQRGQSVSLSDKVSLHKGDITILEVDAIVNAANHSLLGGGGVDGCIHRAAGPCLYEECHTLNGCVTGKAKITGGYDLPAKHVIHTVGPIARGLVGSSQREDLEACYKNSLQLVKENGLRSVAFPCISTGIYGFPNEPAAEIALRTTKSWVRRNRDEVDRVIFCVFLETDYKIYKDKMAEFFSQDNDVDEDCSDTQGDEDDAEGDEEGPVDADADMLSQKEEEDEEEQKSRDVEMASQAQDEDEAALRDPAVPSPETKKKERDKEEETATASEESAVEAGGGERKTKGEEEEDEEEEKKEEERGGAGEPAAAERESSSGQLEKKSPGVPDDKLGKGFVNISDPKVRAPLAEEEEVMDVEGDVEDGEQGEPSASKDSDTSTTEAQGEDSQEPELTQTDSNQSKDDATEQKKEPRKELEDNQPQMDGRQTV